ncbi:MAG: HEAT repeat domain-containing protein [Planctomycetota bacterium]|jgi:HEAT repeat protein
MPSGKLEERLRAVQQLRNEERSPENEHTLLQALNDCSNLVVAEAATLLGEWQVESAINNLVSIWPRFLDDPLKSDKGCVAKTAIVQALNELDFDDPDFFLTGMRVAQIEGGWPPEDTAVNVRGGCAYGLVASRLATPASKLLALVDLLADERRGARIHAARALGELNRAEAAALLRLKIHCGDAEPEVMGVCFVALLRCLPDESVKLIASFLSSPNEHLVVEAAAALGEAGHAAASQALIDALSREADAERRRSLLISLGLSKETRAMDFLLVRVRQADSDSEWALEALRPVRFYVDLVERIRAAASDSGNSRLAALCEEWFAD